MRIAADSLVDDIMNAAPATIRAFIDFKMNCVGCPIGPFHSVDYACREHGVDIAAFLAALKNAAANPGDCGLRPAKTAGGRRG